MILSLIHLRTALRQVMLRVMNDLMVSSLFALGGSLAGGIPSTLISTALAGRVRRHERRYERILSAYQPLVPAMLTMVDLLDRVMAEQTVERDELVRAARALRAAQVEIKQVGPIEVAGAVQSFAFLAATELVMTAAQRGVSLPVVPELASTGTPLAAPRALSQEGWATPNAQGLLASASARKMVDQVAELAEAALVRAA
ncbi:hypothetical protein [Streptomyces sp. NPDC005507]|uniref:hypothetical protein n=1 Tax=Streptomyces sp. NPDC005507 TaxID=3154885 RepID=UPI00339EEA82